METPSSRASACARVGRPSRIDRSSSPCSVPEASAWASCWVEEAISCWLAPDAMAMREHLTPRHAGQLAAQAVARRLVLTHFYPPVDVVDILGDVAQYYTGPTVLATDGWSIEF